MMFRTALFILSAFVITACGSDDENDIDIDTTLPDFAINTDIASEYDMFDRKVTVFGVPIYAVSEVAEDRLTHAAHVLAQYLDNNEDGKVDDMSVLEALLEEKAFLVMWKNETDLDDFEEPDDTQYQDLGDHETLAAWHENHEGPFDATLEEVLHLVTYIGYANAYPDTFAEEIGSTLAIAMDAARGGQYTSVPDSYPDNAWYHYTDESCEYECMVTEYVYWGLTSILGAQENRLDDIKGEWELNTSALVESRDPDLFSLLTDTKYNLPTVLPDGSYNPQ